MSKRVKVCVGIMILVGFLNVPSIFASATTTEPLYTQVNEEGIVMDGNPDPIVVNKPVIRPAYVGSNPYEDYIGPNGGFFKKDPKNPGQSLWQQIKSGNTLLLKQMGFYRGRKIALFITFFSQFSWGMRIKDNGGTLIDHQDDGYEIALVYDDGQVKDSSAKIYKKNNIMYESIKDVFLELPLAVAISGEGSYGKTIFATKKEGLNRFLLVNGDTFGSQKAGNVSVGLHQFEKLDQNRENIESLLVSFNNPEPWLHNEYFVITQDNNYPLRIADDQAKSISERNTDLFATYVPPFRELTYTPPKSLGTQNTDRFEAIYDITQAVGIGYSQFYPDSLNIVMDDTQENLFKQIDIDRLSFEDRNGTDISEYMETVKVNDHRVEFKILKEKLELLKNNQINIKINSGGLNSEVLLKHYNKEKNVYEVPVNFYNYKVKDDKKTESEVMTAVAEITPSIYGEPVLDVEASQYTRSSDLDVNTLVKGVATTLPADKLSVSFVDADKDIYFDTVKTYSVRVAIHSLTTGGEKIVTVPIKVNQAIPVTAQFFENQSWLIDEVNRQLAPKKIDGNPGDPPNTVFMSDLSKIKTINLNWIMGNQKIPATINALNKLEQLSITNSSGLNGQIPKEIGELGQLTQLRLNQTGLTGVVPTELTQLTKLSVLDLSKNSFIGKLPELKSNLKTLTVNDTQLTYNGKSLPPFIQGGQATTTNSFVYNPLQSYLQISGKIVKIYNEALTTIRPFSTSDVSVFELFGVRSKAGAPIDPNEKGNDLASEHTYTIIDGKTNKVYYSGKRDATISIPYYKGITYKVILDEAEKNPNNVTTIQTKIQKQKVNVSFVDETGEVLHDPLTFEGMIGTTLDLTKEPKVQAVLKELIEKNYLVKQRPESENAIKIKETESNVQYQLEGSLFVYSHPKLLSFGRQTLLKGLGFIKVEKATFDEPLVIWDNRKKSNSWKVTATLETPLTSLTDPTQTLPEAIRYKKSETDSVTFIEGSSEILATKTSDGSKKYNISEDWKAGKSGFQLEVPTGKVVEPGGYRATILWQVGDTP
ncbi:hypothetical protein [Enterococcus rotai]|uniref:hypothetical protein n=1 Tax=Enterococcus rotai TaxID=118060 RepID=UPI0032B468B0